MSKNNLTIYSWNIPLFQVSLLIRKQLTDRARDFNIILDDVAITELSFGKEYSLAVESKQVAQQEAQRAAFVVDKAKQERQQKIVQAEGEAQAAEMLGEAIAKNPGYLKLRKLRASQHISQTVSLDFSSNHFHFPYKEWKSTTNRDYDFCGKINIFSVRSTIFQKP